MQNTISKNSLKNKISVRMHAYLKHVYNVKNSYRLCLSLIVKKREIKYNYRLHLSYYFDIQMLKLQLFSNSARMTKFSTNPDFIFQHFTESL